MPVLPEGKSVYFRDKEFNFSYATSLQELLRGLTGVTSLDPYSGMLFDFGMNHRITMTPRGLQFPVDVAFLSAEGEILSIKRLDPTNGFTQYTDEPARFALEVPVGFFSENNIAIGDQFEI